MSSTGSLRPIRSVSKSSSEGFPFEVDEEDTKKNSQHYSYNSSAAGSERPISPYSSPARVGSTSSPATDSKNPHNKRASDGSSKSLGGVTKREAGNSGKGKVFSGRLFIVTCLIISTTLFCITVTLRLTVNENPDDDLTIGVPQDSAAPFNQQYLLAHSWQRAFPYLSSSFGFGKQSASFLDALSRDPASFTRDWLLLQSATRRLARKKRKEQHFAFVPSFIRSSIESIVGRSTGTSNVDIYGDGSGDGLITNQAVVPLSLATVTARGQIELDRSMEGIIALKNVLLQHQQKEMLSSGDGSSPGALNLSVIDLGHGLRADKIAAIDPFDSWVNVWDRFPPTISCPDSVRLGPAGEGGKWVCGMTTLSKVGGDRASAQRRGSWYNSASNAPQGSPSAPPPPPSPPCVAYSFGISVDVSFEIDLLLSTLCEVHAFDPTVGKIPYKAVQAKFGISNDTVNSVRPRIHFHKLAMATASGGINATEMKMHMYNEHLFDVMHRLGHSFIDVLKVDIEGGEWDVFADLFGRGIGKQARKLTTQEEQHEWKNQRAPWLRSDHDHQQQQQNASTSESLSAMPSRRFLTSTAQESKNRNSMASVVHRDMKIDGSRFNPGDRSTTAAGETGPEKDRGTGKGLPVGQILIELHYSSMAETAEFFAGAEANGFSVFSREINLIPTLYGNKPVAVEYSLINPEAFFRDGATETTTATTAIATKQNALRPPAQVTDTWHTPIKAVIYFLTQKKRFEKMINALEHLYDNFWRDFPHYPVVLFCEEGDFSVADKEIMQQNFPSMPITFVIVNFQIPENLQNTTIPERTICSPHSSTVGYRHMCRFHASLVHSYLDAAGFVDYEYIMRLDDDGLITHPVGYDVFRFMKENKKLYGFVDAVNEGAECVTGLYEVSDSFWDSLNNNNENNNNNNNSSINNRNSSSSSGPFPAEHGFYRWLRELKDPLVFYNNFEVSHASIWQNSIWKQYFDMVDKAGGIYMHRWGDAPIHTIGLSMFLSKLDLHRFRDIGYIHEPYTRALPSGLPMAGIDPFEVKEKCVFYDHWTCNSTTNGEEREGEVISTGWNASSNSTRWGWGLGPGRQQQFYHYGKDSGLSAVGGVLQDGNADYERGVLYTFSVGAGQERQLAETLTNFYETIVQYILSSREQRSGAAQLGRDVGHVANVKADSEQRQKKPKRQLRKIEMDYADESLSHLVVFENALGAPLDRKVMENLLPPEVHRIVTYMAVQLPDMAKSELEHSSCGFYTDAAHLSIINFMRFKAVQKLALMGYRWFMRFDVSSFVSKPLGYNIFEKLQWEGKIQGSVHRTIVPDTCPSTPLQAVWAMCGSPLKDEEEKTTDPGIGPERGSSGENRQEREPQLCKADAGLHSWPPKSVFAHEMSVQHLSLWTSPICQAILAAAGESTVLVDDSPRHDSSSSSLGTRYSSTLIAVPANRTAALELIAGKPLRDRVLTYGDTWDGSTVLTMCSLATLSAGQMLRLENEIIISNVFFDVIAASSDVEVDAVSMSLFRASQSEELKYTATSDERLNAVFRPQRLGWLGGDVATSIPLPNRYPADLASPPKTLLWLFGDSVIGGSSETQRNLDIPWYMVTNSVGVSTLAEDKFSSMPLCNPATTAPLSHFLQRSLDLHTSVNATTTRTAHDAKAQKAGAEDLAGLATRASKTREIEQIQYYWRYNPDGSPAEIFSTDIDRRTGEPAIDACAHNPSAVKRLWVHAGIAAVTHESSTDINKEEEVGRRSSEGHTRSTKLIVFGDIACVGGEQVGKIKSAALDFDLSSKQVAFIVANPYDPPTSWEMKRFTLESQFPGIPGYFAWKCVASSSGKRFSESLNGEDYLYLVGIHTSMDLSNKNKLRSHAVAGRIKARDFLDGSFGESLELLALPTPTNASGSALNSSAHHAEFDAVLLKKSFVSPSVWNKPSMSPESVSSPNPQSFASFPSTISSKPIEQLAVAPIFSATFTEASLYFDVGSQRWIVVAINHFLEGSINMCHALLMEGPWQCQPLLKLSKEYLNKNIFPYAGKSHPDLLISAFSSYDDYGTGCVSIPSGSSYPSPDNGLSGALRAKSEKAVDELPKRFVLSHVTNAYDGLKGIYDLNVYVPKFYRLELKID